MLNESPSFLRRYRDPIAVILLLLLPLIFYVANAKDSRDHNVVDRVVVWLSWPVQWAIANSLDGMSGLWHSYVGLVGVQRDNDALRLENSVLRAELAEREEMRLENERFRRLLRLESRTEGVDLLYARIIGLQPTPLFRSLRIDVGESDGVRLGAGVMTHDGAIGRVAAIASHSADVMLIVDAASSVDVLVQRTRAQARIRGSGGDQELGLELQYVPRIANIEPGDLLITSGVGTVFPKGLPVGRVTAVERRAFGIYQHATAEPVVDFRRLEEVLVLRGGIAAGTNFEPGLQSAAPPLSVAPTPSDLASPSAGTPAAAP